jgi:hypothetical protein
MLKWDNGGGFSLISMCVSLLLMFWLSSSEEMYWFQRIIKFGKISKGKKHQHEQMNNYCKAGVYAKGNYMSYRSIFNQLLVK